MNMDDRVRRARFDAAARVRAVVDLEAGIATMEQTNFALTQFVAAEEQRTKVTNRAHVTYSLVAKDAVDRSQRLQKTIAELKAKLCVAIVERDDAAAQISILEATSGKKLSASRTSKPLQRTHSCTVSRNETQPANDNVLIVPLVAAG